ncbi:MAG: sigma-54-dependent Fis family transcriptional regulator, partial [Alphaproteobacteria bacterium]|nr:sigma-54-dependent Fis family transcriptional regulator [Alphaproteobacteria bacterium]
ALADHFCEAFTASIGRAPVRCHPDTVNLLRGHDWPANLRELEEQLRAAILMTNNPVLYPTDFPDLAAPSENVRPSAGIPVSVDQIPPVSPASDRFCRPDGTMVSLSEIERDLINYALVKNSGSMAATARALGIGRSTLYRKMELYALAPGISPKAA